MAYKSTELTNLMGKWLNKIPYTMFQRDLLDLVEDIGFENREALIQAFAKHLEDSLFPVLADEKESGRSNEVLLAMENFLADVWDMIAWEDIASDYVADYD